LFVEREGEVQEIPHFIMGTEKYLAVRNSDIFRAREYFRL
jgi:hypothetical protein